MLTKLNLPPYKFKLNKGETGITIWDNFRMKNIVCTPEEWVRQNFLRFLVEEKQYPKGLIAIEKSIKVNNLTKRFDALIFDKAGNPLLLLEFKAPEVKISEATFQQIANYNSKLKVKYLIMSNGIDHYSCFVDEKGIHFYDEIPNYTDL